MTRRGLPATVPAALAVGGVVNAGFAAGTATLSPTVGLVCCVALPLAFRFARRGPGWAAALGATPALLLLPLVVHSATGHDARFALAGALLAVSVLHASRCRSRRDELVALAIELAVLACGLSQLGDSRVAGIAWCACWLPAAAIALHPGIPGELPSTARPGATPRGLVTVASRALLAVAVAGALWSVVPHQGLGGTRDLGGGTGGGPTGPAAATGRFTRSQMDLTARGPLSPDPQLIVSGTPELWRTGILTTYTGTGWTLPDTVAVSPNRGQVLLPPFAGDVSDRHSIRVTVIRPQVSVLSVGQPLATAGLGGIVTEFGDVEATPAAGSSYSTLGGRPGAAEHAASAPADEALWLQLPTSLPARVRALATSWSGSAVSAPEVVAALDAHLGDGAFTYDLNSPVPAGGADAVDDLLFRSHRGFCEQYAATLAVLLRTRGIPSRVVTGWAYGSPAAVDGNLVRGTDAHAWVEFWTPGSGWTTTDPTSLIPLYQPPAAATATHRLRLLLLVAAAALLAGCAGAGVLVLRRRRPLRPQEPQPLPTGTPTEVTHAFGDLLIALADTGHPRHPNESPADLLLRIPGGWERQGEILPALEAALWHRVPPDQASDRAAATALRSLASTVATRPPGGSP